MTRTLQFQLLLVSALALFLQLALIRFLGSEIRIFAYYKNLVLIACFLGFGVGFYRAGAAQRLSWSLLVTALCVALVSVGARSRWQYGPTAATNALSNFAGSLTMGEQNVLASSDGTMLVGFAWALALFVSCLVAMYGFAQRIGADIASFPRERRLEAYSLNVAGSLIGIAAFSVVSWLAVGPIYWFVPALGLAVLFLPTRRARFVALGLAPILALSLIQVPDTIWTPYQRLNLIQRAPNNWSVMVNGTGYMGLESFAQPAPPGVDRWRLPHTIYPDAQNVLVIGAGGGNDVAAALHAGAKRVVAVEIDPEILKVGRRLHPDAPYSDPRVQVVIDDARHFGETTQERFDLIVFSHLDSHTALSGFTNVRLDNYIYTVESFRTFRQLLRPHGALYVSFFSTRAWVAERLRENLRVAFEQPPATLYASVSNYVLDSDEKKLHRGIVLNAHFVATTDAGIRANAERIANAHFYPAPQTAAPLPSTDDWPYLFVEDHHIPIPMLILAIMLAGVSALFVTFHVRGELRGGGGWPIDRHFFFLGAGFLLVEIHNVGRLARVFGTTWSVNAFVIAAVLGVVLAANLLVQRWPAFVDARAAYVGLIVCLLACARIPIEAMLTLPLAPVVITFFYTLPLFFAGVIFAHSFQAAPLPMRALGSNLLGALLGGFLELASFMVGLAALLYIAALLYTLSYPLRRASVTAGSHAHA